jgi:ribonuclease HI
MAIYTLHSDGGARGNPGPAGIGYVLRKDNAIIAEAGEYIGKTTNNVAEYTALLRGIEAACKQNIKTLSCFLDSELVVKQMRREYKVKDARLASLFTKVWNLTLQFDKVSFTHIRREKNKDADRLVNVALDAHAT